MYIKQLYVVEIISLFSTVGMSGWIETKKKDNKRRLSKWMVKLECDERFVYKVPTLQQFAAAVCVSERLFNKFDKVEEHAFKICARNIPIEIIYEAIEDRIGHYLFRETQEADYVYHQNCWWRNNIEYAYAYQDYDVVHKSLVNYTVDESKRLSVKRRLFD